METFWIVAKYILSGIFIFAGIFIFVKSISGFVDSSNKKEEE